MKIGIALSGGGARGMGHLGVLQALEENGIRPTVLSGTSAGSIVSSMYSYGYKPLEILDIVMSTKVFPNLKPALSMKGLLTVDTLGELIKKYIPENDFSALKIPVYITATDIISGNTVYFSEGPLDIAVKASSCVPIFFSPIEYEDKMLVDGGVIDNLPVTILKKKCDFLIGVHSNAISPDYEIKSFKSVMERSLLMAINGNTIKSKEFCDFVIEPPEMGKFSGFDLAKGQEMFDVSYDYTLELLSKNPILIKE